MSFGKKFGRLSEKSEVFVVEKATLLTWKVRARRGILDWLSLLKMPGAGLPV